MSKDGKVKDKSKRRESKSGSESKKSRKSSSSAIDTLPITVVDDSSATNAGASTSRTVTSAFERMYPVLNLPIPPVWTADPYVAFSDLMDTLVMRYVPQLSGVLITHAPTRFLQDTAVFSADSAFATAAVGFECVVWRPKIGQLLEGTICLSSPSHVSLLLYGLFNASIPASHLPEAEWEFVHDTEASHSADHGMGHWRNRTSGEKLGGTSGKLEFTVISLTVANHMLSVHGSLLADPLNGPSPTNDRSYLKKSLLPSQALGLGSARSPAAPRTRAAAADAARAASSSPAPTPPRRVRWEDEDTDAVDSDDPAQYATPPSIVKAEPAASKSKSSKGEKTKRKSISAIEDASEADGQPTDSPKREKKRRKEA